MTTMTIIPMATVVLKMTPMPIRLLLLIPLSWVLPQQLHLDILTSMWQFYIRFVGGYNWLVGGSVEWMWTVQIHGVSLLHTCILYSTLPKAISKLFSISPFCALLMYVILLTVKGVSSHKCVCEVGLVHWEFFWGANYSVSWIELPLTLWAWCS